MKRISAYYIFVIPLLIVLLVSCSSGPTTIDGIWDEYVEAYKQYHRELADFGVRQWPDKSSAFETQKEYQLARVKLRDRQFNFLKERYPERIPVDHSVHDLIHFEWHDRWDTELYQWKPSSQSLASRVETLRSEFKADDRWDSLREKFQQLDSDSRYYEINRRYQDRLSALNEQLEYIVERRK